MRVEREESGEFIYFRKRHRAAPEASLNSIRIQRRHGRVYPEFLCVDGVIMEMNQVIYQSSYTYTGSL